jgi:hypothetical protein
LYTKAGSVKKIFQPLGTAKCCLHLTTGMLIKQPCVTDYFLFFTQLTQTTKAAAAAFVVSG